MRVVHVPSGRIRTNKPKKHRKIWLAVVLVIVLVLGVNYVRPLPNAVITITPPQTPAATHVALAWPGYGQSSVAAEGFGVLATHGQQEPLATASIAKVITALCVLEKYPLKPGEQGPMIPLTEADAERYQQQIEYNGSRLYVEAGEEISEYKAIQAIMLPSANNIADSLAIWAFGSLENYQAYATKYVAKHGMKNTTIGLDASGLDPSTASTATDLAKLGLIAQQDPVLSEIASQRSAVFPLVGTLTNYNATLGDGFMTGIKTGNNDQNLGAFLYGASQPLGADSLDITGAVMDGPDLQSALVNGAALARSASMGFESYNYVKKDAVVGRATTAWGASTDVTVESDITVLRWKGHTGYVTYKTGAETGLDTGTIGIMTFVSGPQTKTTKLVIDKAASNPSIWWRVTRMP